MRRQIDVRLTATTVEYPCRGRRVASHPRSVLKGRHTTADEHVPEQHRQMGHWTPQRFIRWADNIGPNTAALITNVLGSRRHPQQVYRSRLGLLRLLSSNQNRQLLWGRARLLAVYWTHGGAVTYIGVGQQKDRVRRCKPGPPSRLNSWEKQALDPGVPARGRAV